MKTDVFWLDLCHPSELKSVTRTAGRQRFEMNWKNNLSFVLTNINQFKYDYKINSIPFAAFVDTSYTNFTSSIKSAVDLNTNSFFAFEVNEKSPNKERFLILSHRADSLYTVFKSVKSSMLNIQRLYKFDYVTGTFPKDFDDKKNSKVRKEHDSLSTIYSQLYEELDEVNGSMNRVVSFNGQKKSLSMLVERLGRIRDAIKKGDTVGLAELANNINEMKSYYPNFRSWYGTDHQKDFFDVKNSPLLDYYQQTAQALRVGFSKMEMEYQTYQNKLLSSECKEFTKDKKAELEILIQHFLDAREVYNDLQSLYFLSPLQNDYLEKYLLVVGQYADFLFKKFTGIRKVMDMDTVYIMPTNMNMKNFDYVIVQLEKTNKISNESEKYEYDIFIKGGLKIDFSVGVFGSFLKNDTYFTSDSLDDQQQPQNKKMIRRVDNGRMNIGFGGMVNVSLRSGASWLTPGFSVGLILSTQPSLQFLSSLTLGMGKSERLLLHGGCAMGFVKRIDNLPLNEYVPAIRIGDAVRTVDKFLARPFIGLSYNLSKNNVFKVTSFTTSDAASER